MSLSLVTSSLQIRNRSAISVQAWEQGETLRAEKVARFRRYAEGDHDNRMTTEQRRLLNIKGGTEDSSAFNDNLCSIILDTMLDRIQLTGVNASAPKLPPTKPAAPTLPAPVEAEVIPDTEDDAEPPDPLGAGADAQDEAPPETSVEEVDPIQQWVDDLLERNRFDALQVDVHEAALRDGNSYLMVYPEKEKAGTPDEQTVVSFSHETAYDGSYGMVVLYETTNSATPMLAVKVWRVSSTTIADTVRVNVYYADKIERYVSVSSGVSGVVTTSLQPYSGDGEPAVIPWLMPDGTPIGVPVMHFRNRGSSADNFGLSELENVIPLQDATNVTLYSLVATTLLSGFPIRAMVGYDAPADVAPGRVISISFKNQGGAYVTDENTARYLASVRLEQYEVAELNPMIEVLKYLKGEMYAVTNTPTDDVAADASGEARKQSEVKLIGKVKRFEVRNGNAWEDAVRMAARVQEAFAGDTPPLDSETKLSAAWKDAEIRNDETFVASMLNQYREGVIDQRTYLEKVADIYDYTPEDIDKIIERTEHAKNAGPMNMLNGQDAEGAAKLLESMAAPPPPELQQANAQRQQAGAMEALLNGDA